MKITVSKSVPLWQNKEPHTSVWADKLSRKRTSVCTERIVNGYLDNRASCPEVQMRGNIPQRTRFTDFSQRYQQWLHSGHNRMGHCWKGMWPYPVILCTFLTCMVRCCGLCMLEHIPVQHAGYSGLDGTVTVNRFNHLLQVCFNSDMVRKKNLQRKPVIFLGK